MNNMYLDEGLRMANLRVWERKKKKNKEQKQKENVNAIVDFASNLFKVLDSSGISAPKVKTQSAAFKSFVAPPKDYNGVIAGNMFKAHFSPIR